ncbi:hypothetical protein [Streptomyces mutabilis]|uniref:hypothetical protein n=1 Tax=Streptomyces mutabilis TaxID=67332 RepID=UPI003A4C6118
MLGATHALAPGHGRTLMATTAAARGGGARLRDVLPMAASVTVTHTLGAVALGLLVTAAGVAVVRVGGGASRLLRRRPRWASGRPARTVRRAAPLGSACLVVALGAGSVFRGAASALG